MSKKLIRLTESDLHRIVKESVNRILSEAINELDPRTYASLADKRAAQGKKDKADNAKFAASNAWSKKYGMSDYSFDTPRTLKFGHDPNEKDDSDGSIPRIDRYGNIGMDYDYDSIEPKYSIYYDSYVNDEIHPIDDFFNPTVSHERDTYDLKNGIGKTHISSNDHPSCWKKKDGTTDIVRGFKGVPYGIKDYVSDEGLRTAKEMQQGNGVYVKGKGWQ